MLPLRSARPENMEEKLWARLTRDLSTVLAPSLLVIILTEVRLLWGRDERLIKKIFGLGGPNYLIHLAELIPMSLSPPLGMNLILAISGAAGADWTLCLELELRARSFSELRRDWRAESHRDCQLDFR